MKIKVSCLGLDWEADSRLCPDNFFLRKKKDSGSNSAAAASAMLPKGVDYWKTRNLNNQKTNRLGVLEEKLGERRKFGRLEAQG